MKKNIYILSYIHIYMYIDIYIDMYILLRASQVAQWSKNLPAKRCGLIPELGKSPGEGNGNSLQYS